MRIACDDLFSAAVRSFDQYRNASYGGFFNLPSYQIHDFRLAKNDVNRRQSTARPECPGTPAHQCFGWDSAHMFGEMKCTLPSKRGPAHSSSKVGHSVQRTAKMGKKG